MVFFFYGFPKVKYRAKPASSQPWVKNLKFKRYPYYVWHSFERILKSPELLFPEESPSSKFSDGVGNKGVKNLGVLLSIP